MPPNDSVREMAAELVVIAGDVDDARALARLAQDFLHDVVVRLRPIPSAADLPAVDDVADEIKVVGFGVAEKIEEVMCLAAGSAEMQIGNPDRPESQLTVIIVIRRVSHRVLARKAPDRCGKG